MIFKIFSWEFNIIVLQDLAGSLEIVENKIAMQQSLRNKLDSLQTEFLPLEERRLVSEINVQYLFNINLAL